MTEFDPKSVEYLGLLAREEDELMPGAQISLQAAEVALGEIADGVIVTDAEGVVTYCNPLIGELTGNLVGLLPGLSLNENLRLYDDSGAPLPGVLPVTGADSAPPSMREFSACILRPGEEREPLQVSVQVMAVWDEAILKNFVLILRDTSATRRIASRLSWQTSHDSLTRLPNRQFFESELQKTLSLCNDKRQHHVLLYLDIYQFKVVNDALGYGAGDQLLVQLAQVLRRCLSSDDLFARVGSDEFAILLRHCTLEEAGRVVARLRETVQNFAFHWDGSDSRVALSIGVVTVDRHASSASQLLAAANDACSAARDQGRNRVKLFSDSRKVVEKRRETTWVAEIHAALREDRLMLYRQPVVTLKGEQSVHHYEVLVRMRGRDGGVISPGLFLPAAERYGLIEEIDRWVIRRIFAYMALEQRLGVGGFGYAVNISGISLGDETFADFVLRELTDAGVAPSRVQFEITETSAIDNLERALIFIHKLRAAGCSFALDDFGRGVSSLAYLRQLPVDYLKIDGSFVRNMLEDEIDSAMVSTIDHLAKRMGISTIAEYVETPELMEKLRLMGVDYAQGFGIAAAASLPEISEPPQHSQVGS
ncbi:diguanylate cyclase (GGDEF) domain-containing protein [Microbulbifer donghaiensis]|uniref:Diguanylate cyclase (GGDEF) domain-containing protein n=1 Tax=Microbulbifer donghaiensis TaxID=494016 RepID=A0A1M5DPQ4_9GAMM|nr:EAL domain-containing protein [Microbulbifer donghaiensis]SHF68874.1 diguanylate cyclase (GGDEF) domain-containing protein [Microbulbifer donghaiensis]